MTYFESEYLRSLDWLMRQIPNFAPRGHGVMTVCRHEYTAKDCDCRSCLYHVGRGKNIRCGIDKCDCLKERISAGIASRKEILTETMSNIRYPPFQIRLNEYMKESRTNPMDYRNEKHRLVFTEAIEKLNRNDYALMSSLYLLTAEHRLWTIAKSHVVRNEIDFDNIKLQNCGENTYTLFCSAKDLYLGTKHITIHWNGTSDSLYLFEAPIDMLSFISMNKDGWQKHSYAACCGVSDRVLWQMLKDNPNIKTVCLCLDNDEAGQLANKRISEKLTQKGIQTENLVPTLKDWNEVLLYQNEEGEEQCQALVL